ncbi:hypothetical protein JCM14722_18640 [Pseudodesulfovibrio portus]|uniref:Uncharacterized protein n=1 Tax=Pseudodesulfovibrio portus TaxID=231439 RepID=A0ABN6RWF2_9BACT|nr:hypothetical protein JCM14722_18640 [Pseudodesulfovibrio portus]
MIRLAFGAVPNAVAVRFGKKHTPTRNTGVRPSKVSCVWDSRLRFRPRRLALTTGATPPTSPRMSSYHGRYLYA